MLSEAGSVVFLVFLYMSVCMCACLSLCISACPEAEKLLTRNGCNLAWIYMRYDEP